MSVSYIISVFRKVSQMSQNFDEMVLVDQVNLVFT